MEYLGKWMATMSLDPHAEEIAVGGQDDQFALMRLRFGKWIPLAWFGDREAAEDFTYVMDLFMTHLPLQRDGGVTPQDDPFWGYKDEGGPMGLWIMDTAKPEIHDPGMGLLLCGIRGHGMMPFAQFDTAGNALETMRLLDRFARRP